MEKENKSGLKMETLMKEYGTAVLRTAYLYIRDFQLAEDIYQDVFLKVNQKISDFRGDSSIKTWILRITINTCKDYMKSAYYRRVVPVMEYQEKRWGEVSAFDRAEQSDRDQIVRETLLNLPLKYRDIIILVYYHELTVAEAARVLHIAEGTAKSRLKRGRDKMKSILERRL